MVPKTAMIRRKDHIYPSDWRRTEKLDRSRVWSGRVERGAFQPKQTLDGEYGDALLKYVNNRSTDSFCHLISHVYCLVLLNCLGTSYLLLLVLKLNVLLHSN